MDKAGQGWIWYPYRVDGMLDGIGLSKPANTVSKGPTVSQAKRREPRVPISTDTQAENARHEAKPYKRAVKNHPGLYLYVAEKPSLVRSWRYDYRIGANRETLTYGQHPDLSLADAHEAHTAARKLVARGESPAKAKQAHIERQRIANANTVKAVCERWYEGRQKDRSQSWRENCRRFLDQDVYPLVGSKAIQNVSIDELEGLIRRVAKDRGPKSAHHLRLMLADVYSEQPRELHLGNPARDLVGVTKKLLKNAPKGTPKGQALPTKDIPALIHAIERSTARQQTKLAARLLLLTFTRKTELVHAPWTELDLERAQWKIPAARMKADRPHIVPLSQQAVVCFQLLMPLSGGSIYVFPNLGSYTRPMSETTLNKFFHDIGFPHFTPHSARSTASTILNGQGFSADAIELQLAHVERNRTRAAYNYADKMEERIRMMQQWATFLDSLEEGNVSSIRQGKAAA